MTNADKKRTAQAEAWNRWFFSEYRRIGNVRERFVRIALDHADLSSSDPPQLPLFSSNGYFGWQDAKSSAHTFTICGLFVRACRAAARILEPSNWEPGGVPPWLKVCLAD